MRNPSEADPKRIELLFMVTNKMHTNLLSQMLKQKNGIDAIISPNYAPSKMEDGQYLYMLKNNPDLKENFTNTIATLCREKENIKNVFEKSQIKMITQISDEIKLKDVKKFFDEELKRLENNVLPGDVKPPVIANKENPEKIKVDALIKLHVSAKSIDLKQERFFMLIREYVNDTNILRTETLPDEHKEEKAIRIVQIANLIQKNKDSVEFFQNQDVVNNPELKADVIKYLHALCYNGHIKNLKTLMTEYLSERDLLSVTLAIPLRKKSVIGNFDGLITLEGITSMINKRAENSKRADSSEWREMGNILDKAVAIKVEKIRLSSLSLDDKDDHTAPAARSIRIHSNSAKNVANTDNPGPARG